MKTVTRSELATVPEVPFTDTWTPWHHSHILDTVDAQLEDMGLRPIREHIELSDNRMNMFGHIGIAQSEGAMYMLGFRNSMQKSFALGFVAGETVYVCSNMGFFGSFREVRIHNASLTEGVLFDFVRKAIESVREETLDYQEWFAKLKHLSISKEDFKVLTFDIMQAGIVPPSKFHKFSNDWDAERKAQEDYASESTLAHFYGAATRTLRGSSVYSTMGKTRALNQYIRDLVPAFESI